MLPNKIDLMIKLPIIHNRPHKVEVMHKKSHAILEIQGTLEKFATKKFIYSEKATKFCEIFTLLLTVCIVVKSKAKISQNFVTFSEYMNFN